jgi:hypothetical protein
MNNGDHRVGEPSRVAVSSSSRRRSSRPCEDLEHPLNADTLVEALDSTFRIVENCLDRWTLDMLDEKIRRTFGGDD